MEKVLEVEEPIDEYSLIDAHDTAKEQVMTEVGLNQFFSFIW